ncbi:MAG: histidine phosphatase family protein [Aeriscardovia sp.]|nr:histidine phosphatase family protein [Aeriscardovia sp.]
MPLFIIEYMKVRLYMVRHGQTYFNRYGRLQGWSEAPLTPEGEEQCRGAAEMMKGAGFCAAFSSDLRRAQDSLKIELSCMGLNVPVKSFKGLREEFFGFFEGFDASQAWIMAGAKKGIRTFKEALEKCGEDGAMNLLKEADPFSDAEGSMEYWKRMEEGYREAALWLESLNPQGPVLQVGHGSTMLNLLRKYGSQRAQRPSNGEIFKCVFDTEAEFESCLSFEALQE